MKRGLIVFILFLAGCSEHSSIAPSQSLFSSNNSHGAAVSKGTPLQFPRDHGEHYAHQLEWWYLTFVLEDENETPYAAQFTLFRFLGNDSNSSWSSGQLYMAHGALHSRHHHAFSERFARGKVGNAGVTTAPFSAFLDDWAWQSQSAELFPSTLTMTLHRSASLVLNMESTGPLVLHGDDGYSEKSADGNFRSYYYSQPFINVSGELTLNDKRVAVSGNGWFDHEWTSELANDNALGWDWFSLHLDNGDKVMAFRMHVDKQAPHITGTYITKQGNARTLPASAFTLLPETTTKLGDKQLPLHWRMTIPKEGIDVSLRPFKTDQLNRGRFSYYEGRIEISGSHTGAGFMELTGY
ncbi:lipocalin-like domain-containing protein [Alteromonas sp. H39]|uniref:lipocalin-like domain-containing protein n=1 Tax=Alteromonas sp. H39 TaxID=3389876 RepID=UPI0039DF9128